jgi:hypothetical protein
VPAGIIAACTWHMRMEVSSSILHYTCRYMYSYDTSSYDRRNKLIRPRGLGGSEAFGARFGSGGMTRMTADG